MNLKCIVLREKGHPQKAISMQVHVYDIQEKKNRTIETENRFPHGPSLAASPVDH